MNFVLRFLFVILQFLYAIILLIEWLKPKGKKQTLPKITDALLTVSATDLAEKIRKREITSEHICNLYIKRIKEVNPFLNAVVEERFETALQEARNVDIYLQSSVSSNEEIEKRTPLLGVPLTIKESCSLAGLSFCVGTLGRAGIKADKDGEAVAKLKKSGAILLLVSNTPEICLYWETHNFITGRTNNPYDFTRSSSGSSGGEGALLGAGASLIGIGSDVAGSIRLPAMFNGVFGHKPSPRIIPIKGHFPYCNDDNYANYLAVGPMTRYSKDLKLMLRVMVTDAILPELNLDENPDLSQLNVFFMEKEGNSFLLPKVQQEITLKIKECVEYLRNTCKCHIMEDYKFPDLQNSCEIAGSVLFSIKDLPNLLKAENQHLLLELLKSIVGLSNYTSDLLVFYTILYIFKTFIKNDNYLRKNENLRQLFAEKLGKNGVFLYPTFTTSAFKHNRFVFQSANISYLMIFNSLGLPATHVPCGLDKNGLPIGIQVVAGPNQDRLCLAVAEELEKCFGGWIPPSYEDNVLVYRV